MKALSICQPWATCIATKGKNVENRSWGTRQRGYIAIHASAAKDMKRFEYCQEAYGIRLDPAELPFGAVLAFAELVNVVTEDTLTRSTRKWFSGEFGLVLSNVLPLRRPVGAKGALGFWDLKGKELAACLAQLSVRHRHLVLKNRLSHPQG
jgi:hypothetical protein